LVIERFAALPALAVVVGNFGFADFLAEVSRPKLLRCFERVCPSGVSAEECDRAAHAIGWSAAVQELGVPMLYFHDLRHTGNTIAARTGASTRALMARMGHDSPQAAMICQHATSEADRAIAAAVDNAVRRAEPASPRGPRMAQVAVRNSEERQRETG
jgi:hypothetical protein